MKKILIMVYSAFLVIMVANFFYYSNLYNKQIQYIVALLDRQVQIVGLSVDNTNNEFTSDFNEISYSEDLTMFFKNKDNHDRAIDKMKLFYSKYENFVTGIKLFDNNRNEFTLKKDELLWLPQDYILHVQGEIYYTDKLVIGDKKYEYFLPVLENNIVVGNIAVSVDYQKYFDEIFSVFNLKDYQWQWVVSDSGEIIYDNADRKISYSQLNTITTALNEGSVENLVHKATIENKMTEIISSYYSTQLLGRDLGIVFSAPTDYFQKYIIRNSIFIVVATLFLIQVIIFVFWRRLKSQKSEEKRLEESEKMLFKLIEEMPVGVIIHNKDREIIKANKVAATQYSYPGEKEMKGKLFPETSISYVSEYFAKNLAGTFNPDQFVIIKKEIGEIVLYRNSIPVVFMGEEANMEILIDVTMLESARKQEAKANVAKSEFLARMSYEIRTPLNGIIGMTDVLNKYDLTDEIKEIVLILRRSTEILLNIINDILDFSKIETGKMILDEIPFDLREEVSYCADLAKTYIADKDIRFSYSVDENVPESVIADPFRLRQILTNIIYHSARSTDKGEIRLNCRLQSNKSGIVTLGFELADTGMNFDKTSLKKIFGDFVNIESKVKSSDESGFGTILARQLVEMMGGELIAESPSGISGNSGTKIRFSVTAYSNDRIVKNLSQENIRSFDKIRTLIITGSQNRDEEILGSLHKLGLNVSVTTFQKLTVNQIKANLNSADDRYRLVIILDDEEFNGYDAARAIWENNLSGNIIIIMISSNDMKGNYMKCITMGIDHYLVKPYNVTELAAMLRDSFPYIETSSSSIDISDIKSNIKILVVDDNKMNQKVISTMLKILGYKCDMADDGMAGYTKAKEKHYDLIFMDLIMPEMNGYDCARKILTSDKTALIAAFTADNMPDAKRKAELSGIKEFIAKPVRIEELKKLLAKHFKKN
jgi:signal transduction histidine kinase/CheY-like chemotaxis protein/cbb3-type cytochrome oxidase subunit 3